MRSGTCASRAYTCLCCFSLRAVCVTDALSCFSSRIVNLLSSAPAATWFMIQGFFGSQVQPGPVSPACQTLGWTSRASLRLIEAPLWTSS